MIELEWRALEADAHKAKADACQYAAEVLRGVLEAVATETRRQTLAGAVAALEAERFARERAAMRSRGEHPPALIEERSSE